MYFYKTSKGIVSIIQRAGRWHVMFEGADLGGYISPEQAADDVGGGHTFTPPSGIDLGELGIPRDISEWSRGNP